MQNLMITPEFSHNQEKSCQSFFLGASVHCISFCFESKYTFSFCQLDQGAQRHVGPGLWNHFKQELHLSVTLIYLFQISEI